MTGELRLRTELLAEVVVALETAPAEDGTAVDVTLELAIDAASEGNPDLADQLADRVLESAPTLRGRALLAKGMAAAWRGGSGPKLLAEGLLGEAVDLLIADGEREWAAGALIALGSKVAYLNGDLDVSVRHLRRGLDLLPAPDRFRGVTLTFLAESLSMVGAIAEAVGAAHEARVIGLVYNDHRILGYAAWSEALAATVDQNTALVHELLHETMRHGSDWFAGPSGAEFLAAAADLLGRLGDPEAEAWLSRAEIASRDVGYPDIAWLARAAHEARIGDAAAADVLLLEVAGSDETPPREHWRLLLLRAVAAHRRGEDFGSLVTRARSAANLLGHPELLERHEPRVMELLARPPHARQEDATGQAFSVRVLGGFAVLLGGEPVAIDPGLPRGLVSLLAVSGGRLPSDEVTEALWPDMPQDVTRVRLRNLLYRLRGSAEGLVRRDGEDLCLVAAVDLVRYEGLAAQAVATVGDTRGALAESALASCAGELLPADRYAEWAMVPRERVARLHLAMIDIAVDFRVAAGRPADALGLLDVALLAEPLEDERYAVAARLARLIGRESTARRYEERAAGVRRELGLP